MSSNRDAVSTSRRQTRKSLFPDKTRVPLPSSTIHVPNEDTKKSMSHFKHRNYSERKVDYRNESMLVGPFTRVKYQPNDAPDLTSREPSFRNFKIPYEMICGNRYKKSLKDYEAQLNLEIRHIINFQRSAADACYFIRLMAITSIWPPLHHMSDVNYTSRNFFELSKKEKDRLQIIMTTDII